MLQGATALRQPSGHRVSQTLSAYIARQYSVWLAWLFCAFSGIVLLATIIDLLDRLATKEGTSLTLVIEMALLKVPHLAQEITPFVVLFSGLLVFTRLTRTHELVVVRAAGVSVWQFLLPVLGVVFMVGLFVITLYNPIAATLLQRYEQLEARYIHSDENLLSVSKTGLWLRQAGDDGQWVIHARRADSEEMRLYDVIAFHFQGEDRFQSRIDAESAVLQDAHWRIHDAWVSTPGETPRQEEVVEVPTDLTRQKIFESFAPPETISFWALPDFIDLLERAGFSSNAHRLQFHKLLSLPALLGAMVLLSAIFSFRPPRRGRIGLSIVGGVLTGFILYFLSNFVFALGLSGKIPVILAAWMPAGVALMIGATLLLHQEDG